MRLPDRVSDSLSGATLAHFERLSHEGHPRWRLKVKAEFKYYKTPFEEKSQEQSH